MHVSNSDERRDQVRWGPVWAGALITLSAFIVLEVTFFAFGWLTFAQGEPGTTAGWVTAVIAIVAFVLGGAIAGATAMWRSVGAGVLHGVLVWALTTVAIIFLTVLGGGALFGAVADVFTQIASLRQSGGDGPQPAELVDTARSAANWAVLGLALSIAAAALGGALGVKAWPRRRHDDAHRDSDS